MRTRIAGTNGEGVIVAEMVSQAPLVSGTNIKTVSGNSLLGSGDLQLDVNDIDGLGTAALVDSTAFDAAGSAATVLSALAAHDIDTTSVHGIADTSALYRAGGTDVAVSDGGTGASDAAGARTNLGLVIGGNVQAYDPTLAALAAWTHSSGVEVATFTAADTLSVLRVGTSANNLVQLDGSGRLPAVDASQLTDVPAGTPADASVTNAKLANVATATFKGRTTAGTGVPEDLTAAQARTILSGTAALDMVRLDSDARLPAVSGRNLTELERMSCPFYTDTSTYLTPICGASSTIALSANVKYLMPIWVTKARTFTEIATVVTTLGASSSIRAGIRNSDSDGLPTTLVHEIASPFDATSTGLKTAAISQALGPGMYYLELVTNVGCTIVGGQAAGNWGYFGRSLITGVTHAVAYLSRAFTYGALPADETGVSQSRSPTNTGPVVPIAGIR